MASEAFQPIYIVHRQYIILVKLSLYHTILGVSVYNEAGAPPDNTKLPRNTNLGPSNAANPAALFVSPKPVSRHSSSHSLGIIIHNALNVGQGWCFDIALRPCVWWLEMLAAR